MHLCVVHMRLVPAHITAMREGWIFGDPKPNCTLKPETLKALKKLEKLSKLSKYEADVSLEGARGYTAFLTHLEHTLYRVSPLEMYCFRPLPMNHQSMIRS